MGPRQAPRRNTTAKKQNEQESSLSSGQNRLASPAATQGASGRLKALKEAKEKQSTIQSQPQTTTRPVSSKTYSPSTQRTTKLDLKSNAKSKGSIQSFFNAASQRLQETQQSPQRMSRGSTPLDLTETIESDNDDASSILSLSKGSSIALALKKRKTNQSNLGQAAEDSLPASQKFRRVGESARLPSMTLQNDDKRPWTVQFAPTSIEELAVHRRKIADVRGWLENAFASRRNRALILKGPAGSGKTATLQLLAEDLGVEVIEWSNSAGKDNADAANTSSAQFEDFIARSGRSSGLSLVSNTDKLPTAATMMPPVHSDFIGNQLLLVEEFPSTFSKTSPALQSFRSAVAQHLVSRGNTQPAIPLIMVVSETLLSTNTAAADSFTTHRLLGPELSIHPSIDTIEFNTIAPTILLKALEAVVVKEARKSGRRTTPGPAILKRLTEFGDIRSAISTLEFLCLRGDQEGNWSARIAFGKPKKRPAEAPLTKVEQEALEWIASRENSIGIFHGIGKVLYNKRTEASMISTLPAWMSQHHRPLTPENDVNSLANDIGTDTSTFIAGLHENYLLSCSTTNTEQTLDNVLGCVEDLSDSDLLSIERVSFGARAYSGSTTDTLRQDEMSFQLAVRGLLFSIPANTKRTAPASGARKDAHRMYYPTSLKLWRQREEIEQAIDLVRLQLRTILQDTKPAIETAYSLANTNATHWSREQQAGKQDAQDVPVFSSLIMAPKDMFVECLPYISISLQSHTNERHLQKLMRTITYVNGDVVDDTKDADAEEAAEQQEAWATDCPEDTSGKSTSKIRIIRKSAISVFGHDGRATQQQESLILEDDDIVDDQ